MRLALAVLLPRAAAVASPALAVVASSSADGPLVEGISASVVAELVAYWAVDYPRFLLLAQSLINADVLGAESAQPEGAQMQLQITGLVDPLTGGSVAGRLAAAVNGQWAAGKITDPTGEALPAWPGASAIAYPDDGAASLTLQWVKGQPWVWIIVGVLLAVAALALYEVLAHGGYSLSASAPGSLGAAAAAAGGWLLKNWPVALLGAAVLVGAPFVVRELAKTGEAVNEARFAARGGF